MSEIDADVPPAGEQLHIPKHSVLPVVATVGITLALVGVTVNIVITIAGLLIAIPSVALWVRAAIDEFADLPPGH